MKKDILKSVCAVVAVFGGVFLLGWGLVESLKPASMEHRQELVNQIKLCTDNNLKAYQGGDGTWYCEPK